jgi:nicotinate phosphoribosyltransferase
MHQPSPLLTDFYQLTMAYAYWQLGKHEQEATFHLLFRRHPFKGDFALCAGLGSVISLIEHWRFSDDDLAYLASLSNANEEPLFNQAFIDALGKLSFTGSIDAVPEGTVVFANEPILRVQAPLWQCQLLESILLNFMNFQTLIATKAARVCEAAGGDPVFEFGMRRAQGPDGALSASRAAYIGGCVATSNALAGKLYDIPVRGTHAHSFVTAFDSEPEAFAAYIKTMPHQASLLVDTYNTVEGVKHAIAAGRVLREQGADLLNIRLDSGDLADLSIKARALLDEAGFENTGIIASNSLDEHVIRDLKSQGAKINVWGVGTHLTTAYDQPALDGVYKMGALKNAEGEWTPRIKLSEQAVKISNPGRHQVRRYFKNGEMIADVIFDLDLGLETLPKCTSIDGNTVITLDDHDATQDLLEPVFVSGKRVQPDRSIHHIQEHAADALRQFRESKTTPYPVYLEKTLHDNKLALIQAMRA